MSEYLSQKTQVVVETPDDLELLIEGDIVAVKINGIDDGTMMVSKKSQNRTLVLIKTDRRGIISIAEGEFKDIKIEDGKLSFYRQQTRLIGALDTRYIKEYDLYWRELEMAGRVHYK